MNNNVRYMYLRDENRKPVACLAIKRQGKTIEYAVATHHPRDEFSKEIARKVALGRLNSLFHFETLRDISPDSGANVITRKIIEDIINNKNTPKRTSRVAKLWLNDSMNLKNNTK